MNISMHNLQREIFLPSNERLSAFMCVNKPSKKKKTILCAAGKLNFIFFQINII